MTSFATLLATSTSANQSSNHRPLRQIRLPPLLLREWFIKLFCVFVFLYIVTFSHRHQLQLLLPPCGYSFSSAQSLWANTVAQFATSFVLILLLAQSIHNQGRTGPYKSPVLSNCRSSTGSGTRSYENTIHAMFTPTVDESGKGVDVAVTLSQGLLFLKLHNKYSKRQRARAGCAVASKLWSRINRAFWKLAYHRGQVLFFFVPYLYPQHPG